MKLMIFIVKSWISFTCTKYGAAAAQIIINNTTMASEVKKIWKLMILNEQTNEN